MLVKARFTRCAFYGVPPLGGKTVELPRELITAQKLDLAIDVTDTIWEDGEQLDTLLWEVFEARGGFDMPLSADGPGGWTLHWSSWSLDSHLRPA
jgi:hypothetical protein